MRQYIEDREITAWLLLDLSPSVDFGTANARKRDLVVDFAGVMARLLTRHGNKVGAMLFSQRRRRGAASRAAASCRRCAWSTSWCGLTGRADRDDQQRDVTDLAGDPRPGGRRR